jgi:citrate lyase alpha subunit
MVIVAAMGSHPTTDAEIRIDSVIARGPSVVVYVAVVSDTRNLCTTGRRVTTHPADIVKLANVPGDVVFRESYFAAGCKMY